jgi:general stress protein 26
MSRHDLEHLARKMRAIDFVTLFTRTETGALAGRPTSNNGEVEYDGDSWFFTYDDTRTVRDIEADPHASLACQGAPGLLGKPPVFITVTGRASVIRERARFAAFWRKDLERWFPQGIDTPGMVLLKVTAERLHWWDGEDDGEIVLEGAAAGATTPGTMREGASAGGWAS